MANKYNTPLPEKKRRKAQKLLEDHGDFHPQAARKLSRILRKLAEGPEDERNGMLSLFNQVVSREKSYHVPLHEVGILIPILVVLWNEPEIERTKILNIFTQIVREK